MSHEETIFAAALAQPPAQRATYLNEACGSDAALRERIVTLLAAHACLDTFLDSPGFERALEKFGERPGDTIGRYTLVEELGEGGCGVVYLAEQAEPVRRRVALKVIKAGMDTREVIGRFAAERQALALMEHPGIAKIYDAGTTPAGRPFFVMELVRGVPITTFCDQQALTLEARLGLFLRICDAVQHAHHKGIIHRDLKPSNILVMQESAEPSPKVIDFGIAKATQGNLTDEPLVTKVEQFIGTPAYMSPEQAGTSALDIDTRSDVYSLGVLFYELLVGHTPFDARTLRDVGLDEARRMIREVEPPTPSRRFAAFDDPERAAVTERRNTDPARLATVLRGDLDWIAMRALEKNRARRYETPAALAADIARHLHHEPVLARPPSKLYRVKKTLRRNRLAFAAAAALSLSLLAGTIVSAWQAVRAGKEEQRANLERGKAVGAYGRAEQLLEFMIGDLRTQLAKVGRLDMLEAVGDRAMSYFASIDPSELNDAGLAEHAKTLTQLGEIRMAQARYSDAIESFRVGYVRAAAAVARQPENGDFLFRRGQAEFGIGYVHQRRHELSAAGEWLQRYRDTCVALAALDPHRPEWQRELAFGQHNLAVLRKERGEVEEARQDFLGALATWQRLHDADRANLELRFQVCDTISWLGELAEECGDYAEAAMRYAERAVQFEEMARIEPSNRRWRQKLADSRLFQADVHLVKGNVVAARELLKKSRELIDELVRHDPANRRWLGTALNIRLREAWVARQTRDQELAWSILEEIRPQVEQLVADEPTERGFVALLARTMRSNAQILLGAGQSGDAEAAAAQAIGIGERSIREGRANAADIGECLQALLVGGEICARRGDHEGARRHWKRAADLAAENVAGSRSWRLLDPAARLAAATGRTDEARRLIAQLNQFGYVPLDPWPDADRLTQVPE